MSETTSQIDRYGVIGYPIAHSRSPVIHTVFARMTNQHMTYEAMEVAPRELEAMLSAFRRSGGSGLNVTVPHKSEVVRLVDELSDHAATAGAVNTLSIRDDKLFGDNTDGIGLVRDLTGNLGWPIEDQRILILGAGGATRRHRSPVAGDEAGEYRHSQPYRRESRRACEPLRQLWRRSVEPFHRSRRSRAVRSRHQCNLGGPGWVPARFPGIDCERRDSLLRPRLRQELDAVPVVRRRCGRRGTARRAGACWSNRPPNRFASGEAYFRIRPKF